MADVEHGWKRLSLSSSTFLADPEEGAHIASMLATKGSPVYYEIYPFHQAGDPWDFLVQKAFSKAAGGPINFNPTVDVSRIRHWQAVYPHVKVSRVHAPFAYDLPQAFWQAFLPTTTTLRARGKNNLHHLFYLAYLGAATNGRAQEIARKTGAKLSIHASVAKRYGSDLGRLTFGVCQTQVENSPSGYPYWGFWGNLKAAWDPTEVIRKIIMPSRGRFSGLVLGLDHLHATSLDPMSQLRDPLVLRFTRAIHISERNHGLIDPDKEYSKAMIKAIAQTRFVNLDELVLDVSPLELLGLSTQQKFDKFSRIFDWLNEVKRTA